MYDHSMFFSFEEPLSVPLHSMDTFERHRDTSESISDQQRYALARVHSQQILPSFRDIIPAHLHNAIETAPSSSAQSDLHSPTSTSTNLQAPSEVNRSHATSPIEVQQHPMPSFGEGFDEYPNRVPEAAYSVQPAVRRHSDQIPTWGQPSQYPEVPTVYNTPQPSMYQNQQQFSSFRSGSGLPSMREQQPRPDKMANGMDPNQPVAISHYPPMHAQNPTGRMEAENIPFVARNRPYQDPSQRHQQSYPQVHRHHQGNGVDYPRYQQHYDPYRNNSYNSPYSEMEYPPQPISVPQNGNFNMTGDPVDSRGKRRRGNLPKPVTDILRAWFHDHLDHPYPTEEDKQHFIARTGLTLNQISNWFINARRRQLPSLRQNRERASQLQNRDRADRYRSQESSIEPR